RSGAEELPPDHPRAPERRGRHPASVRAGRRPLQAARGPPESGAEAISSPPRARPPASGAPRPTGPRPPTGGTLTWGVRARARSGSATECWPRLAPCSAEHRRRHHFGLRDGRERGCEKPARVALEIRKRGAPDGRRGADDPPVDLEARPLEP